jgi:hypothetical protein
MFEIEKKWKMDTLNWDFFKVWVLNCKHYERLWVISEVFPFKNLRKFCNPSPKKLFIKYILIPLKRSAYSLESLMKP